jgi:CDP-6-deoxy-D-xylo-4-hexulose-3-dehydrase
MFTKEKISEQIQELIKKYFSFDNPKFIPGKTLIPLSIPTYDFEEVNEALDSLLSTWVTMGKKVKEFERLFSEYMKIENSVMVNSGSSANLVALSILTKPNFKNKIKSGEEIITPAITFATTVYPIANVNLTPVIVDVNLDTFNINVENIEAAITNKTRAIMPVHLLGNPCEIKKIINIAEKYDLFVIEDTCESYGALVDGKKVGTFGDIGTLSFFLSHHISTIEGGMILTNNEEYAEIARAMRVFGWIRDLKNKEQIAKKYTYIDKRYLFTNLGYNFRPTEIQGAFGIHQIKKLEKFIEIRRKNARYWIKRLKTYSDYIILQKERANTRHVWYGFPLTIKPDSPFTREELTAFLEQKKIETRPIMAGDITQQPVMNLINHRVSGDLSNSKIIMKNSFFFGNHHGIDKEEREYIADVISEFIDTHTK